MAGPAADDVPRRTVRTKQGQALRGVAICSICCATAQVDRQRRLCAACWAREYQALERVFEQRLARVDAAS